MNQPITGYHQDEHGGGQEEAEASGIGGFGRCLRFGLGNHRQ